MSREIRDELAALVPQIISAMGPPWEHRPHPELEAAWSPTWTAGATVHVEGEVSAEVPVSLHFHADHKRRLSINVDLTGIWDYWPDRYSSDPSLTRSISVSFDRDPAAIAKDVLRRLVPDALKGTAEALRRKETDDNAHANAARVAEQVVIQALESYGVEARLAQNGSGGRNELHKIHAYGGKVSGVEIRYAGDVNLSLHYLTVEDVRRVLAALKEGQA